MSGAPHDVAIRSTRSALSLAISDAVTGWNLTRAQAAERLGIAQSQLDDLLRGRVDRFSLEALVRLSAWAGITFDLDTRSLRESGP